MTARDEGLVHEAITGSVIGAFFEVYNELGYGFLENVYAAALEIVLRERGHSVRREVRVIVYFRGIAISPQRIDMVVDDLVVIEIKSTHILSKASPRQLYSYLKSTKLEVGLLLHFGPEARFYRHICSRGA
jgi:GxxExxY protein